VYAKYLDIQYETFDAISKQVQSSGRWVGRPIRRRKFTRRNYKRYDTLVTVEKKVQTTLFSDDKPSDYINEGADLLKHIAEEHPIEIGCVEDFSGQKGVPHQSIYIL